jgi:ribosomal-protein-alanine N-acetyltransferase
MVRLESERLIMRNYQESDLNDYHRMMSDKENMYYQAKFVTKSIEESQESLKTAIAFNTQGKGYVFCIALKESDKLIGGIGYEVPRKTPLGKIADPIGWFLIPEYHNKGYMTEAAKKVVEFAFLQDNCIRVVTACYKENVPSHKVIIKAGFRQEAEKIQAMWHDGQMKDRLEFALNRNEFMKIHGAK